MFDYRTKYPTEWANALFSRRRHPATNLFQCASATKFTNAEFTRWPKMSWDTPGEC